MVLLDLEELEYVEAGYRVHADVVAVDIFDVRLGKNSLYFIKRTRRTVWR